MPIDPISLPNAAAIDYGNGDVRHFSEGDALDVPGLSRPTRELAQRDVDLASKLNETIAVVNNKEQFVPILVPNTTLPPNSEEIVVNFRIPAGFESRILNAIISSAPPSVSAELDIYYSTGYGNSTGTQVVSTSGEFTAGSEYFSDGEYIITLKNRGGATLNMLASIQATMRPLLETQGVLIPSAVVGKQGPPGPQGPQGPAGGAGSAGSPGSPGLTWQSTWNSSSTYSSTDVVFWLGSSWKSLANSNSNNQPDISPSWWELLAQQGSPGITWQGQWNSAQTYNVEDGVEYQGSSYVCVIPNTNQIPSTSSAYWNLFAQGGNNGFRFRGAWSSPPSDGLGPYLQQDVVNILFSGSITQTYVAVGNPPNPSTSPPNSDWDQLFSAGAPAFQVSTVTSSLYAESSFLSVNTSDQFGSLAMTYPGTLSYALQEAVSSDQASGHGIGFLKTYMYARWIGDITLTLPSQSSGAQLNWDTTDVVLSIQSAGTLTIAGTLPTTLTGPSEIPGFDTSGTVVTSYTGPAEVPGSGISVVGNFISTYQNGTNITIHNPTSDAANVTIGMIGFQVF